MARSVLETAVADSSTDHPVGMAYLLGNWATDRQALAVAGRWIDADLYQARLIFHCRQIVYSFAFKLV